MGSPALIHIHTKPVLSDVWSSNDILFLLLTFIFGLRCFMFRLSMDGKAFICITVIELMMHPSLFSTSIEDLECIKDNEVKYCNIIQHLHSYVLPIENKFVVFLIKFLLSCFWTESLQRLHCTSADPGLHDINRSSLHFFQFFLEN